MHCSKKRPMKQRNHADIGLITTGICDERNGVQRPFAQQQFFQTDVRFGSKAESRHVRFMSALPLKADIAAPCRALTAWLLIAASLVLTLAASTVRSNRGPIGVGDPEEVEPQPHSAG